MKILVGDYDNLKINQNWDRWQSINSTLRKTGEQGGLGGVDHYMCRSIKTIVSRYVRRLKRDDYYGYPGAAHDIVILLQKGDDEDGRKTIIIPVRCE